MKRDRPWQGGYSRDRGKHSNGKFNIKNGSAHNVFFFFTNFFLIFFDQPIIALPYLTYFQSVLIV